MPTWTKFYIYVIGSDSDNDYGSIALNMTNVTNECIDCLTNSGATDVTVEVIVAGADWEYQKALVKISYKFSKPIDV
jgi:hypothetical protein